jgi:hypothetical protein
MEVVALENYGDGEPEPMEAGPVLVVSRIYIVYLHECLY